MHKAASQSGECKHMLTHMKESLINFVKHCKETERDGLT